MTGARALDPFALEQRTGDAMAAAKVPGLAIAIALGDRILYARGFGVTSVEDGGLPVTPETLFRIGSTTKPLTGTAVMRLVEQGVLDLDRPIGTYADGLRFSEPGAIDGVTLRMLLSHRAGLATAAEHFGSRDPSGLERYVRAELPRVPMVAPPGKLFSYSNPGISLVGFLAQAAAGRPYVELMQELVFAPLGMTRTTFDPTVAMTYPIAQSHALDVDGSLRVERRFADNTGHYPAGFAFSTVLDLARFAVMQMNQGRFRDRSVLAPESVAEMQRPQARVFNPDDEHYGLTWRVGRHKGVRMVGHGGAISSYGSVLHVAPDERLAVSVLFNRLGPDFPIAGIVDGIFDELLGLPAEVPKPEPVAPNRALWPSFTGTYLGDWTGLVAVRVSDDALELDDNGEPMPLQALADDLYVHRRTDDKGQERSTAVGFVPETDGPVEFVVVGGWPARRSTVDPTFVADPTSWEVYAGVYEGDFDRVTVRVDDGRLRLHLRRREREVVCAPIGPNRFACPVGRFEFVPEHGAITELCWASTFTLPRVDGGADAGADGVAQ